MEYPTYRYNISGGEDDFVVDELSVPVTAYCKIL